AVERARRVLAALQVAFAAFAFVAARFVLFAGEVAAACGALGGRRFRGIAAGFGAGIARRLAARFAFAAGCGLLGARAVDRRRRPRRRFATPRTLGVRRALGLAPHARLGGR